MSVRGVALLVARMGLIFALLALALLPQEVRAQELRVSYHDIQIYSCEDEGPVLLVAVSGRPLIFADGEVHYAREGKAGAVFFDTDEGIARINENEMLFIGSTEEKRETCTRIDHVWQEAIGELLAYGMVGSVGFDDVTFGGNEQHLNEVRSLKKKVEALERKTGELRRALAGSLAETLVAQKQKEDALRKNEAQQTHINALNRQVRALRKFLEAADSKLSFPEQ